MTTFKLDKESAVKVLKDVFREYVLLDSPYWDDSACFGAQKSSADISDDFRAYYDAITGTKSKPSFCDENPRKAGNLDIMLAKTIVENYVSEKYSLVAERVADICITKIEQDEDVLSRLKKDGEIVELNAAFIKNEFGSFYNNLAKVALTGSDNSNDYWKDVGSMSSLVETACFIAGETINREYKGAVMSVLDLPHNGKLEQWEQAEYAAYTFVNAVVDKTVLNEQEKSDQTIVRDALNEALKEYPRGQQHFAMLCTFLNSAKLDLEAVTLDKHLINNARFLHPTYDMSEDLLKPLSLPQIPENCTFEQWCESARRIAYTMDNYMKNATKKQMKADPYKELARQLEIHKSFGSNSFAEYFAIAETRFKMANEREIGELTKEYDRVSKVYEDFAKLTPQERELVVLHQRKDSFKKSMEENEKLGAEWIASLRRKTYNVIVMRIAEVENKPDICKQLGITSVNPAYQPIRLP